LCCGTCLALVATSSSGRRFVGGAPCAPALLQLLGRWRTVRSCPPLASSGRLAGDAPCTPALLQLLGRWWTVRSCPPLTSSGRLAGDAPCTPALFLSPPVAWPVQHRAYLHSDPAAWSVVHRAFLPSDPVPCWTAPSRVSDIWLHGVARGCPIYGCGLVSLLSCSGLVGGGESPSGMVAPMSRWTPTRVGSAPC
jgi:hypothetical protein